ncbi:MAG: transposase [Janthinobacterium lividum]
MTDKKPVDGQPVPRKKYTPAFKAECVRQVAAGARQSDVARAQGISPALLGRWQRTALEQAVPSSAERVEIERGMLDHVLRSLNREQVRVYQDAGRYLDAY